MPRRLLPLVKVRLFTKPPYVSGLAKAAGTSAGVPRPIKISDHLGRSKRHLALVETS